MLELIGEHVFYEVAALLVLAAVVGFIGVILRQPLIVSFIAVGIIAGPAVLDVAQSGEHIELLSELGIALLLFLVGIKLDVQLVRTLGVVSLITGLGQVAFTSIIGFFICLALGLDPITSTYVAVALTFSSTIIIVKLLSDKREIDSLHGRIAVGFLIVQDLVVVLAMIVLSALGIGAQADSGLSDIARVFGSGMLLLVLVLLFIKYLANPLSAKLAQAPELLVCFSLAMAALFAAIGEHTGFGKEMGGLLAGVALASTPYREAIASRLAPLRDFLLLFFFIALGSKLDITNLGDSVTSSIVLSLFVLIGNPFIVLVLMGAMGYRKRTGLLAGLTVAQISEFSLIFMGMGVALGHVSVDALGLVTLVGLVTIAASTYMITYSHKIYAVLEPFLGPFERKNAPREAVPDDAAASGKYDVILFGLGRFGGAIAQRLTRRGVRVLGIDFNPAAVRRWQDKGFDAVYGDTLDPQFVESLPLNSAQWAVSTVPDHDLGVTHQDHRLALMHALKSANFGGRIAVTSHHEEDSKRLRHAGADLVLQPFQDAADQAVELIETERQPERIDVIDPENQIRIAN